MKRTLLHAAVTVLPGVATYGFVAFDTTTLSGNLATFITLFDYFQFRSARVRFIPSWVVNDADAGSGSIPLLALATNYDDASAPASVDAVLARGGKIKMFRSEQSILTFPHALANIAPSSSSLAILPSSSWYNSSALIAGTSTLFPLCQYALAAEPFLPGSSVFRIYIDYDIMLAQRQA